MPRNTMYVIHVAYYDGSLQAVSRFPSIALSHVFKEGRRSIKTYDLHEHCFIQNKRIRAVVARSTIAEEGYYRVIITQYQEINEFQFLPRSIVTRGHDGLVASGGQRGHVSVTHCFQMALKTSTSSRSNKISIKAKGHATLT